MSQVRAKEQATTTPRVARDFYAELVRATQASRAGLLSERERWLRGVNIEGREEQLFEFEMLLRAVERYFNLHHVVVDAQERPLVTRDFHEELEDVRDALQKGHASSVQFKVKGALHDFPFDKQPKLGEFNITAQVQDVHYAYVPPRLQAAGELPWPALTRLSGRLVFDRNGKRAATVTGLDLAALDRAIAAASR